MRGGAEGVGGPARLCVGAAGRATAHDVVSVLHRGGGDPGHQRQRVRRGTRLGSSFAVRMEFPWVRVGPKRPQSCNKSIG